MIAKSYQDLDISYLKYRIFHFMWCIFILNHHLLTVTLWLRFGNPDLQLLPEIYRASGILAAIFLVVTLFKPNNPIWFALMLLFWSFLKLYKLPWIPNHIILSLIVNFTIITAIFLTRAKKTGIPRLSAINQYIAPYLRYYLVILYFFTVFHKINWDYLNPDISCGFGLYNDIVQIFPFLPVNQFMIWTTIIGTLVIETLIPVLLLISRTRMIGITLGVLFHFILALHPNLFIGSFTYEVFALYSLFLPDSIIRKIWGIIGKKHEQYKRLTPAKRILLPLGILLGFYFIITIVVSLLPNNEMTMWKFLHDPKNSYKVFWYGWAVLLIFGSIYLNTIYKTKPEKIYHLMKVKKSILLVFLGLILFNGFTPYLGIKTATNFSMFSNLLIYGDQNNHLILRQNIPVSDYSSDIVEIIDTNDELLNRIKSNGYNLPFFEIQRWVQDLSGPGNKNLTYKRNNEIKTIQLPEDKNLPELNTISWLEKKFLVFRGIPRNGSPCPCQW